MEVGDLRSRTESEPFLSNLGDIELGEQAGAYDGVESGFEYIDPDLASHNPERIGGRQEECIDHDDDDHKHIYGDVSSLYNVFPFLRRWRRSWRSSERKHTSVDTFHSSGQKHRGCCDQQRNQSRSDFAPKNTTLLSWLYRLVKCSVMFLGILQILALLVGIVATIFPHQIGQVYRSAHDRDGSGHWPTDFSADIVPVKCHSHNDYWRKIPLFSAIKAGCTGVEADVWLHDDELFVGHIESSLTPNRTFRSLYVNPLLDILNKQNPITEFQPVLREPRNGVFDTNVEQNLVLLVDFKTNGDLLWPVVQEQLEPLRSKQYLTHFNGEHVVHGPVTVVVTGNAPFHKVVANLTYRDMFFDAPLAELAKLNIAGSGQDDSASVVTKYDPSEEKAYLASIERTSLRTPHHIIREGTDKGQGYSGLSSDSPSIYTRYNSYYASTSLIATIGTPFPYFTTKQREKLLAQIAGAHQQGLQSRYWEVPAWPISWRNYMWRELVKMGIDYLNVDDLKAATSGKWMSIGNISRLIWGIGGW